ncbi:MAG: tetraacyldisaccharide 4'-kinase [Alphaproteobacteria bacterium]|nr:tetraacyldisaccharide 4'-kinase [Alphaproteobacteria bacterium]
MLIRKYPLFWQSVNILSLTLYPFSIIFYILTLCRKYFSTKVKIPFPLICIGNATVGGTGKTRLIKLLARHYLQINKKVIIISKAYGGKIIGPVIVDYNYDDAKLLGDEAIEICYNLRDFTNLTVIASNTPDRAINIIKSISPDLIFVDDGLQNPAFYKDIKILMVDGIRGFGNEFLIPAGPLREGKEAAINDADWVVSFNPSPKISKELTHFEKFYSLDSDATAPLENGSRVIAFCGIGNPQSFFRDLRVKFEVVKEIIFPDHYAYTENDLDNIEKTSIELEVNTIITTEKDMAKIRKLKHINIPIIVATSEVGPEQVKNLIEKIDERIFK